MAAAGRQHLWRFDLTSRRAEVVVEGGWVTAFDKAAGALVPLADAATHPGQLTAQLPGQPARRIETFNDTLLARLDSGRVEEHWIRGAVGAAPVKPEELTIGEPLLLPTHTPTATLRV